MELKEKNLEGARATETILYECIIYSYNQQY